MHARPTANQNCKDYNEYSKEITSKLNIMLNRVVMSCIKEIEKSIFYICGWGGRKGLLDIDVLRMCIEGYDVY